MADMEPNSAERSTPEFKGRQPTPGRKAPRSGDGIGRGYAFSASIDAQHSARSLGSVVHEELCAMFYMGFDIASDTSGRHPDKTRWEWRHLGIHHLFLRCTGASEAAKIRVASLEAARKVCSSSSARISRGIWA